MPRPNRSHADALNFLAFAASSQGRNYTSSGNYVVVRQPGRAPAPGFDELVFDLHTWARSARIDRTRYRAAVGVVLDHLLAQDPAAANVDPLA